MKIKLEDNPHYREANNGEVPVEAFVQAQATLALAWETRTLRESLSAPEAEPAQLAVVTTEAELDALPFESVILMGEQPRIKRHDGQWLGTGKDSGWSAISSDHIIHWYSRATVVHTPKGA